MRKSDAGALEWAEKNGYEISARKVLKAGGSPNALNRCS